MSDSYAAMVSVVLLQTGFLVLDKGLGERCVNMLLRGFMTQVFWSFRHYGLMLMAIAFGLFVPSAWALGGGLAQVADSQVLTVVEQQSLKQAIEDYEFQEQSKTIFRLEKLLKDHPNNLDALHYLGLSYEETQQFPKAQGAYAHWLKYSGNSMDDHARFAWMGMAKAYDKTKHTAMGVKLLKQWLARHPKDYDATVALGDMLVREKEFGEVSTLFHNMLAQQGVPVSNQSSAHYYLGYAAWLEGDVSEVQNQGERMLRVDPESGFASVIKQLMAMPPPRRLGLNVTAGIDTFFVNNVGTKPSYLQATTGNKRTTGLAPSLGLAWNFRHHLTASYNFGGTFYTKRPDLNIALHMVGLTWADNGFQFGPKYEHILMYNKLLYQGVGADLGWGKSGWMLMESLRYKTFSKSVKVLDGNTLTAIRADLSGLGGWSNSLMVLKQTTWGSAIWMLGANFAFERTKGTGITDKNTNNYEQLGGSMTVMYPHNELMYAADINGYVKRYRGADVTILAAKRKDEYIHVGGGVTWTPAKYKKHSFSLKTEWNNNGSNYDFPNFPNGTPDPRRNSGAAYSQWKHSMGYAFAW